MSKNTIAKGAEHCLSVADAFERYSATLKPGGITSLRSALVRFVVPGLGGATPKGERLLESEIAAALAFMATVPSERLADALEILNVQMDKQGVKQESRHVRRSHIRQFVTWAGSSGFIQQAVEITEPPQAKPYSFRAQSVEKVPQKRREIRSKYILENAETSERLATQLKELEAFAISNLQVRPGTFVVYLGEIKRLLGWLHRIKGCSLEDLSLDRIVPYVRMRYSFSEFEEVERAYEQYAVATVGAKDKCIEEAERLERLLDEYFRWRGASAGANQKTTAALVAAAKFLYDRDVTDYNGPETIPVIKKLQSMTNKLGKAYQQKGRVVPIEDRMVDWFQALDIALNKLPVEADLEHIEWLGADGKIERQKRTKQAIANDLHQLLMLAFLVLIPPDRQRTWRELELDRTLKRGVKEGKRFTSIDQLKPGERDKAKWYVHLMPDDYKTGATYGEVWQDLPNVEFPNGKTLYDYMDRWLNEYREVFEPKCKNFFVQRERKNKGQPIRASSCTSCIRGIFLRFTGVPVTPHILRDMYATHIREQGASLAELEGAARLMKHSLEMANKVYDQRTNEQKAAPALELNQRIIEQASRKPSA